MNSRIYYTKPSIGELELEFASDAVRNGWGDRCYEYVSRFERMFCEYTGALHAVATSSCTGALHVGLSAIGIGHGDEVILADTNWIASAAPITYLGARPVFVDILPESWCLDPDAVERAITPRTRAILAVHLYGNVCAMDRLLALGTKYNLPVIEDAAEAIGSMWRDRTAGTLGRFGTFSFHGTKTLTTGEGGMLVTNDSALHERVCALNNHGRLAGQTRQFWPDLIGFKYKISNVQAAIGCAQLQRVDELVRRKREIFDRYRIGLAGLRGVMMNPEPAGTRNGYWMPTAVFAPELGVSREHLLAAFRSANIDARVFFWPLSGLPMFAPCPGNVHAYDIPRRAINLPSYHELNPTDQQRVVEVVIDQVRAHGG